LMGGRWGRIDGWGVARWEVDRGSIWYLESRLGEEDRYIHAVRW